MFYLIYGDDNFRSRQKLNEIIGEFRQPKKKVDLRVIQKEEFGFPALLTEVETKSMFQEKKVFVLRNFFALPSFQENFLKNYQILLSSDAVFIFYEDKDIPKNSLLFKKLRKDSLVFEFHSLRGRELDVWAINEFKKYNKEITKDALLCLVNYVGSDLWRLSNEIKKLSIYKAQEPVINKEDVELLVKEKVENDIFRTIDAMASQNKKLALSLISRHLANGDSPLYLLSMIIYQFRNLLAVKEMSQKPVSSVGTTLNYLHPFVVRKTYWQAKKFSLEQLKRIYDKIFKIDLFIKTGKLEPHEGLELLLGDLL